MRILIVSDNKQLAELIQQLLTTRFHGVIVSIQLNLVSAVSEIQQQAPFDLVITGMQLLRQGDGRIVIQMVRSKSDQTKIVLMSSDPSNKEIADCAADAFLLKPFKNELLTNVVRDMLPAIKLSNEIAI